MRLRIINLKNGFKKTIDATKYTISDFAKTVLTYEGSGNFMVKVVR